MDKVENWNKMMSSLQTVRKNPQLIAPSICTCCFTSSNLNARNNVCVFSFLIWNLRRFRVLIKPPNVNFFRIASNANSSHQTIKFRTVLHTLCNRRCTENNDVWRMHAIAEFSFFARFCPELSGQQLCVSDFFCLHCIIR